MPQVRNRSSRPHRYPLWETREAIVWQPGETREVSDAVAAHVCRVHPDKLELVAETPTAPVPRKRRSRNQARAPEEGTETFDASLPRAVNRQQRGGRRS